MVCRVLELYARTDTRPLVFFQSGFQRISLEDDQPVGEVRSVVLSVADMDAACRFYGEGLGMLALFRDSDRWAAFSAGAFNIALAGSAARVGDQVAINLRVNEVGEALATAVAAGATMVELPSHGENEIRAAFRDPDGHLFYVYAPVASA